MASVYPETGRTEWILAQRAGRVRVADPERPHGVFLEEERMASGEIVTSGVVLLTNKECPWRCLMCDLWQDTTTETVPAGAIARQVEVAVKTWADAGVRPRQVKLYNSGSFFDPAAIPPEEDAAIAEQAAFAEHVVVESHPRLIGDRAARLRDRLCGSLEVAMGLETAHPEVLKRLNKKFDLEQFGRAAGWLRKEGIGLRVFLLVYPPFLDEEEGHAWVVKSVGFALECGATAVSLIPTRTGNGAMERLLANGELVSPTLGALERAQEAALAVAGGRGRVFSDTWGLEGFATCARCFESRVRRLRAMNRSQGCEPAVVCAACGGGD